MRYPTTPTVGRADQAEGNLLLPVYITTLSRKGQLTIPVAIIRHMGLQPKDVLRLEPNGGSLNIVPLRRREQPQGGV